MIGAELAPRNGANNRTAITTDGMAGSWPMSLESLERWERTETLRRVLCGLIWQLPLILSASQYLIQCDSPSSLSVVSVVSNFPPSRFNHHTQKKTQNSPQAPDSQCVTDTCGSSRPQHLVTPLPATPHPPRHGWLHAP
jgi:hypothetical protein